jgi:hypothetical protein
MSDDIFEQMIDEENTKKIEQKISSYKSNNDAQKKDGYKQPYNNNYNYNKNYNGESKLMTTINEIKSTLNVLVDLELKRLNITKSDFNKLVENDIKKNNKDSSSIESKKQNEKTISSDNNDFKWTDKILEKIKNNKDDKDKLKEIRKKYDIPKSIFNKKMEEIN